MDAAVEQIVKQRFTRSSLACALLCGLTGVPSSPVGQSQPGLFQSDGTGLLGFEEPAYCKAAPAGLQGDLSQIARTIDGQTGIAVRRVGCSWVAGEQLEQFFPQQSVSKLWVSLAVLDAVDQRKAHLNEQLDIGRGDLTVFHQPLRATVLERGLVRLPMHQLMFDAITHSDNTANDRLLNRVGGSAEIRRVLQQKGLSGIRFGPGERLLQSQIAGIRWTPELSLGRNFEQARARLPMPTRQAALANYLADPIDGATPSGISQALSLLAAGRLLSHASTDFAMGTLARTRSGPRRLKGGVPPDWKVYHKTGTGQVLGPISTGYNDVGILEAPDGARYAVAVMIGETSSPVQARMQMMQLVSAAVAHHHSPPTAGAMASAPETEAKPAG